MRTGLECSSSDKRWKSSQGVYTFIVRDIFQIINRYYADIIDPYSGEFSDFAPIVCGMPETRVLSSDPEKDFEDDAHSVLQAVCIKRVGSAAPVVVGWINPVDTSRNAGRAATASRAAPGGGALGGTTGVVEEVAACPHWIGWRQLDASDHIIHVKNGRTLADSQSAAQLYLDHNGRVALSTYAADLDEDGTSHQYIGFQLNHTDPAFDNTGSNGGIIAFQKEFEKDGTNTYYCELEDDGSMMPAHGENLAKCLNGLYETIAKLNGEVEALRAGTAAGFAAAVGTVSGKPLFDGLAPTGITPMTPKDVLIADGKTFTEDQDLGYLCEWVRTAKVR